jgi:hypothetical protein
MLSAETPVLMTFTDIVAQGQWSCSGQSGVVGLSFQPAQVASVTSRSGVKSATYGMPGGEAGPFGLFLAIDGAKTEYTVEPSWSLNAMRLKPRSEDPAMRCFAMSAGRFVSTDGSLGDDLGKLIGTWNCPDPVARISIQADGRFDRAGIQGAWVLWGQPPTMKLTLLPGADPSGLHAEPIEIELDAASISQGSPRVRPLGSKAAMAPCQRSGS